MAPASRRPLQRLEIEPVHTLPARRGATVISAALDPMEKVPDKPPCRCARQQFVSPVKSRKGIAESHDHGTPSPAAFRLRLSPRPHARQSLHGREFADRDSSASCSERVVDGADHPRYVEREAGGRTRLSAPSDSRGEIKQFEHQRLGSSNARSE